MACGACARVRAYVGNLALALDRAANALLLGTANETVSQRAARAALAGNRAAAAFCRLLNLFDADHCNSSLDPSTGTNAQELWDWTKQGER